MASNEDISIVELSSEKSPVFSSSGDDAMAALDTFNVFQKSTPVKNPPNLSKASPSTSPIKSNSSSPATSTSMIVHAGSLTDSKLEPLNLTEYEEKTDEDESWDLEGSEESASALEIRLQYLKDQRKRLNEVMTSAACQLTLVEEEINSLKVALKEQQGQ